MAKTGSRINLGTTELPWWPCMEGGDPRRFIRKGSRTTPSVVAFYR